MEEFFRWVGGIAIAGVISWITKKFYEKNIEGAIKDAKTVAESAKSSIDTVHDKVRDALYTVADSNQKLTSTVTKFIGEQTDKAIKLREDIKDLKDSTESSMTKLARGSIEIAKRQEELRSEVVKLKNDVFIVKGKIKK